MSGQTTGLSLFIAAKLTLIFLVAGCASKDSNSRIQYVDTKTGVTVSSMPRSLTFYANSPALAVNARDFASLGAVEINRSGQRSYYLWIGLWSTIDRRFSSQAEQRPVADWLYLHGDGRRLELPLYSADSMLIGTADPVYVVSDPGTVQAYYRVTVEDLRFIALADELTLTVGDREGKMRQYSQWDPDQQDLEQFVTQVIEGDPWSDDFKAQTRQ